MSNRNLLPQRSRLTLALIAALTLPMGAALAQEPAPAAATTAEAEASAKKQLEKVTVTGSRIARAEIEGPAPITVISAADIERSGYQTVGEILQVLTQNTTSSFTGDLAVTGFTPNALVVNLRNIGPGYTLTLINGRRPAQYPQPYNRDNSVVNIKAIPSAIIERIEILTGGASAIYGSDAVAGVVNIVTKTNYDGNSIKAKIGTTEEGGGDSRSFEYTGGKTGDNWSGVWALQWGETDPVFASQRELLSSTLAGPRGYIPGTTNPALAMIAIRASGANLNQNAYYPGQAACDAFGYTTVTTATRGTYCGSFDQVASRSIANYNKFYSVYGYGTFDLSDNTQLFASATYYTTDGKSSGGTEFWGTSGDQFMRSSSGATRSTYFDPQFNANIQLQRIFNPFELGGPEAATTLFDEKTWDLLVGAKGTFADRFDWEASASTSKYDYTADRPRLLSQAVHDYFLGPQQGFTSGGVPIYRLNLARWSTPITPDIYESFSTRSVNTGTSASSNLSFFLRGDLWELPAGKIAFAAGAEAGRQELDLLSDPRTNPLRPRDAETIYNLTSSGETHGKRDRYAVFSEFRVPLFSNLTAQIAGRYDKYDDITAVDDAITYNLGLEYRPFKTLLLRSSYATSFRAPDMQLVFAEGAASFSTITDEYACRSGTGVGAPTPPVPRTFAQCNVTGDRTVYQTQTLVAGNPGLKEEEGKTFSAGFVWDITSGMSVTVDYWRIKLTDRAAQFPVATILRDEADCRLGVDRNGNPSQYALDSAYCQNILGLITRLPAEPGTINDLRLQRVNSAYINLALTDTSGIDSSYRYSWQMGGLGKFSLDLSHSLIITNRRRTFETDPIVDFRDDPFVNDQRSRMKGSLTWMTGAWTSTLTGTRYGTAGNQVGLDYTDPITGAFQGKRLSPYFLWNLSVGRKFGEKVNAIFTVNNLANNQFREDASSISYPFFDNFIGADPLGRRYYLSVGYKF
ncbi:MAG: TonB-dependent receptor [Gammaproteobacteria bacterium]|nr:TonB-dependent receptor [Gammaproteobacteria bacterium]